MRLVAVFIPFAGWAALAFGGLFGLVVPGVTRTMRPAAATWLLTIGSALSAASAMLVLVLMSLPTVGRADGVADSFHWSPHALSHESVFGRIVSALALTTLVVALSRATVVAFRRWRGLVASYAVCRSLDHADVVGELVVIPDDDVDAYAVPGRPGRLVMTRGLVRLLSPSERRAVIAHERSHLQRRHHLHLFVGAAAASCNPLLSRVPSALSYTTERWADEDAAAAGDRVTVARALSLAADSRTTASRPANPFAALALVVAAVSDRIVALLEGPPRLRLGRFVVGASLATCAALAALVAADHTIAVMRIAAAVTHVTRHHG